MRKRNKEELELYKRMYSYLFNTITDITRLQTPNYDYVIGVLKQAQIDTEEMYISYEEDKANGKIVKFPIV